MIGDFPIQFSIYTNCPLHHVFLAWEACALSKSAANETNPTIPIDRPTWENFARGGFRYVKMVVYF